MGRFTGEVKTKHCDRCDRKTVHQEIAEDKVSALKVIGGLYSGGLSLPFTGLKSERKSYACSACGTVN